MRLPRESVPRSLYDAAVQHHHRHVLHSLVTACATIASIRHWHVEVKRIAAFLHVFDHVRSIASFDM